MGDAPLACRYVAATGHRDRKSIRCPRPGLDVKDLFSFLPPPFDTVASALVIGVILVSFIAGAASVFVWLERKVSGRIQDRLGPTRLGLWGLPQMIADAVKLLAKEDTSPDVADKFLFRIAPYLAFCASFTAFVSLPFGADIVPYQLNVAAFFILAVLSSEVFGVILAGYASGSKWSLFGGMREAAQVVSYEVPRAISVLVPVIVTFLPLQSLTLIPSNGNPDRNRTNLALSPERLERRFLLTI